MDENTLIGAIVALIAFGAVVAVAVAIGVKGLREELSNASSQVSDVADETKGVADILKDIAYDSRQRQMRETLDRIVVILSGVVFQAYVTTSEWDGWELQVTDVDKLPSVTFGDQGGHVVFWVEIVDERESMHFQVCCGESFLDDDLRNELFGTEPYRIEWYDEQALKERVSAILSAYQKQEERNRRNAEVGGEDDGENPPVSD